MYSFMWIIMKKLIRVPWIDYLTGRTYFFFKWIEDGEEQERPEHETEDSED